ncbi:MAG: hypothetical protein ACR2M4_02340 [Actinomycetota bacterium]
MTQRDPLEAFAVWEGQKLGENHDETSGFRRTFKAPRAHVHIAGGWGTSTKAYGSDDTPGVYVKILMGVVGTGPAYHVLEGFMDADTAKELGEVLISAADRAHKDAQAGLK